MSEEISVTNRKKFLKFAGRIGIVLFVSVFLLLATAYGALYILAKGPSPTAAHLFVRSVRETSAAGFLAELFFSEEEIEAIVSAGQEAPLEDTDTSLITIDKTEEPAANSRADAWGLVDEDGDGLILEAVKGEGFSGYMLVVLDPSRVILGSVPSTYGVRGYTVEAMVDVFDAVAGINAGGFYDPDGTGNGSIPDTMTVFEGTVYNGIRGPRGAFVGMDADSILHVGNFKGEDVKKKNIQYGVCFGPALVVNGENALEPDNVGGLNPRTAIGQRSDGAMLLLVIDGRQVSSIGCTYVDLVEIFLEYGAVNACNLDGGSSTMMWVGDGYVNSSASLIGIRPVPTAFVVLKEGVSCGE